MLVLCAVVIAGGGFVAPARAGTHVEIGMATGNTLLFISDSALNSRLLEMQKNGRDLHTS